MIKYFMISTRFENIQRLLIVNYSFNVTEKRVKMQVQDQNVSNKSLINSVKTETKICHY